MLLPHQRSLVFPATLDVLLLSVHLILSAPWGIMKRGRGCVLGSERDPVAILIKSTVSSMVLWSIAGLTAVSRPGDCMHNKKIYLIHPLI